MKPLLLLFVFTSLLFSYNQGDKLEDEMIDHLKLKKEKLYILDFFASWCGSCKKEIPLISRAKLQTDPEKVEFVGIDVDKDPAKGIAFQSTLKAKGHLNFRVINDPQNLVISKFNPKGMPTLYFIKNAKVLKITTGAVDDIDTHILNVIKGIEE